MIWSIRFFPKTIALMNLLSEIIHWIKPLKLYYLMCFIEWWLFSNCYVLLYKCSLLNTDQNRNIVGSVCALVFLGNTHKVFLIWGSLSSLLHALYSLAILFYWCINRRALYKEFWWNKYQAFKIWALVFFNGVDANMYY